MVTMLLVSLRLEKKAHDAEACSRFPSPTSLARPAESSAKPPVVRCRDCRDLRGGRRLGSRGPPNLGAVAGLELGLGFRVGPAARNPGFGSVRRSGRVLGGGLDRGPPSSNERRSKAKQPCLTDGSARPARLCDSGRRAWSNSERIRGNAPSSTISWQSGDAVIEIDA